MNVDLTHKSLTFLNAQELVTVRNELVAKRMSMDKMFSVFLDQAKLDDSDYQSEEWIQYHSMLKQYDRINDLYRTCQIRLERYAV